MVEQLNPEVPKGEELPGAAPGVAGLAHRFGDLQQDPLEVNSVDEVGDSGAVDQQLQKHPRICDVRQLIFVASQSVLANVSAATFSLVRHSTSDGSSHLGYPSKSRSKGIKFQQSEVYALYIDGEKRVLTSAKYKCQSNVHKETNR